MCCGIVGSAIVSATDWAVLLTFGALFPPLAVVGAVSLVVRSVCEQLSIGRFLSLSRSLTASSLSPSPQERDMERFLTNCVRALNEECRGVSQLLFRGLRAFAVVVALFWAGFAFDVLGDTAGFTQSVWVVPVLPALVLLLSVRVSDLCTSSTHNMMIPCGLCARAQRDHSEQGEDTEVRSRSDDVELTLTHNPLVSCE